MSDKIREALAGMLAIHDEPSGFAGKYGRALDDAIAAQQAKIDQRVAAARAALAKQPALAAPDGFLLVTPEQVEQHATTAWECTPLSRVVPVSTLKRLHTENTATAAAEQPDTVKVPRETAEAICRLVKGIGPVEDLRALLGKELEA